MISTRRRKKTVSLPFATIVSRVALAAVLVGLLVVTFAPSAKARDLPEYQKHQIAVMTGYMYAVADIMGCEPSATERWVEMQYPNLIKVINKDDIWGYRQFLHTKSSLREIAKACHRLNQD